MAVPSSDEGLGLQIDTSDEESEDRLNDEHAHDEPAEDDASSNGSESQTSSPILSKSSIPPSALPLRRPDSLGAEESVTGKPDLTDVTPTIN